MARSRSRSRSPAARRSASPPRRRSTSRDRSSHNRPADDRRGPPRRHDAGFRWKEKRRDYQDEAGDDRRDGGRLERGYRRRPSRSPPPRRDRFRDGDRDRPPRRSRSRERARDDDVADKFGLAKREDKSGGGGDAGKRAAKPARAAAAPTTEPMIIVHVNDRLGTKAAIPCLASDKIGMFKAMVAARIGRETHEIMLKRQSERPFKDMLTLEDYGVSNGSQLDLEVDTGD